MSELVEYAFEDEDGEVWDEYTTPNYTQAREYAQAHQLPLIMRTYVYDGSELIEDFRPGRNADGTLIERRGELTDDAAAFERTQTLLRHRRAAPTNL